MDVIEHYLDEQPLVELPRALRDLLLEASTSDASDVEMAICVAYNEIVGHSDPVAAAGVDTAKWKKIKSKLKKTGKKVAGNLKKSIGSVLVWSGRGSASTHYPQGSDTTPKTDFLGNAKNRFSLKKSGGAAAGAQLMSAASGEASGVFEFALKHLQARNPSSIITGAKEAFDILETQMKATARTGLNVEVSKGKKDFEKWYISDSSRYAEVKKLAKGVSEKNLIKHLKAELSLMGATIKNKNAKNNLIDGITLPTKDNFTDWSVEYIASGMEIGKVKVSQDYLKKVDASELTKTKLRTQIVEVIGVALASQEWKNKLTEFLQNNDELKRWVVYEAASGLGKFTGQSAAGGDYSGGVDAVANKILVFNDGGLKVVNRIYDWSKNNSSLCDNISISYKGSGRRKYIKFGLAAEQIDWESKLLLEHICFDDIIAEEYAKLEQDIRELVLTEGAILDKIKSSFGVLKTGMSDIYTRVKDSVKAFWERVIVTFVGRIISALRQGLNFVLDALGIKIEGNVSVKTPSW